MQTELQHTGIKLESKRPRGARRGLGFREVEILRCDFTFDASCGAEVAV